MGADVFPHDRQGTRGDIMTVRGLIISVGGPMLIVQWMQTPGAQPYLWRIEHMLGIT